MGLAVTDLSVDWYTATGSTNRYFDSLAMRSTSKETLVQSLGLYQGSGGVITRFFNATLSGANNFPANPKTHGDRLSEIIHNIREVFALTKDELANICKVQSRKTLYNWIDGVSTPRKTTMRRIFDLSLIVQDWRQAGFSCDRVALHKPILDEESLFTLLSKDTLVKEHILFVGSRLALSTLTLESLEDPFA